ncbi:hypothetical protein Q3G72_014208 [Acer saccharum]|nr:hypothetical protein Q3G72_014208 [Acer saccharum]
MKEVGVAGQHKLSVEQEKRLPLLEGTDEGSEKGLDVGSMRFYCLEDKVEGDKDDASLLLKGCKFSKRCLENKLHCCSNVSFVGLWRLETTESGSRQLKVDGDLGDLNSFG